MKLERYTNHEGRAIGYQMVLEPHDTDAWEAAWPGSNLGGLHCTLTVGGNGLSDVRIIGRPQTPQIENMELAALVVRHLPKDLSHLWPLWKRPEIMH